ncbi:MAG: glycosyltransferase family 4 protein [Rhodocyclaceae bacterium]|nr:glycosyltransferase family 4 protein [Rhodocyclaceae bacterium]
MNSSPAELQPNAGADRQLRIALIRAKYNPFGGAERFVQTAVSALADEGISMTVLTRAWPETSAASGGAPAVDHVILNPRYFTSTGRDKGFAAAVQQHLSQTHYDLVQSHERIVGCDVFRAGDGVHATWLEQRRRVSGGLKQLGVRLNPHHRYLLATERAMFESPKLRAVICNSQMVKADISRHFDIDPAKLRVILSGVDTTVFHSGLRELHRAQTRKSLRIPKAAPVALFVGSGFERKGLIGFLMGLADQSGHARLTRESVRGVVVGHDKHLTRFQSFADQLGLSDRVSFVGGVNDVRPFYAAADIFVLPTLYDPLPNACLEAMACGLPVITSTGSGAAELITNGMEGFVVDALDTPAIADAIEASLASAMSDNQMGKNAAAKVAPLTPRAMAANYVALYRELLGTNVATGVDNSGPAAYSST